MNGMSRGPGPIVDVVGVGENSVDIVYRLPAYPRPGSADSKVPIASREISPGGQVATTLCACAALGLSTSYVGTFGDDENGALIESELQTRGVNVAHAPARHAANRYAVILIDERNGERVVLWQRDPALTLQPGELTAETVGRARLMHVDNVDEDIAIRAARIGRHAGMHVTSDIDQVTPRTADLVAAVTVPIFAEHVPQALTGEADLETALRTLRRTHQGLLCVTLGERGSALLDGDRLVEAPAFPVQAIDSTGAGDVFRGAFIYGLLRGDTPAGILRFANAAAAVSCTRRGAIGGVPMLQEVEAMIAGTTPAAGAHITRTQ
jgi:sugar/nucleoside kinase (ribokinase family)